MHDHIDRRRPDTGPPLMAWGLAAVLLVAGIAHLVAPRPFDAIIPRVFPDAARRPLTIGSGIAELAIGGMLLVPRTRPLGARLAQVLFVVILPANVQAALQGGYPGLQGFLGSPLAAWLRVPLQIPLILLAGRVARRGAPRG